MLVRVQFAEIPPEGLRLSIRDESWFPDHEINHSGPVVAELFLERPGGEQRVLLKGLVDTAVILTCDRCLLEYTKDLEFDFRIDLEVIDRVPQAAEHCCSSEEMDVVYLEEPAVDIYQMLAQQVLLSLPAKRVCSQDCKGLCPHCGANLNRGGCACGGGHNPSPFSVLAKLKR